jgi:O-methyltransferase
MKKNLSLKLRHFIKRLPYAIECYEFLRILLIPDYAEDGMRLMKNAGFLQDSRFVNAYAKGLEQEPDRRTKWRSHTLMWAGYIASKLDGDFVECGVDKACFSRSVMEYVGFISLKNKTFYLFDTYRGVTDSVADDEALGAYKNEYTPSLKFVEDTFKGYANVKIVEGVVPESFQKVQIDKVAYLSIDMNHSTPERATLEYFWPKMVPGGMIVLDDYAFPDRDAQQQSADEFAKSVGTSILTLPTGQGLLIKPATPA